MSRLTETPGVMLASVLGNVLAATNSFSPYRPVLKLKKRKEKKPQLVMLQRNSKALTLLRKHTERYRTLTLVARSSPYRLFFLK